MGHSAPFSEPPAWLAALLLGLAGVFIGQWTGLDSDAAVALGSTVAVCVSVLIGAPINAAVLDVLVLVAIRPLTGVGVWHALGSIARSLI